jgi:hypothetical protein
MLAEFVDHTQSVFDEKIARLKRSWALRTTSIMAIISSGVMPTVGSSSSSTLGSMTMARAISTRRWAP